MNKLIGLGLGAVALLTASSTTRDNTNKTKKKRNNSKKELVTVTAYFNNSTHYDQNVKSSNGFFYQKGKKTYLVTTAHTIIDNWQSIGENTIVADKVSILYQGKSYDLDTTFWLYSKYYDIMLIPINKINKFEQVNAFIKSENKNPSKVSVLYIDPISNKPIKKEAEYVSQVGASMHLGAIAHPLTAGSSGSPVFSDDEKLVGMITSTDQEYQSMSLTIPAETIDSFIDIYENDFDYPKYLGVETNLINTSYTTSIKNETLKELYQDQKQQFMGELVINTSKENKLNPFDIITSINGKKVGNGLNRSINIALANTTSSNSVSVNGFKIDPDFRKKFCAYPRDLLLLKDGQCQTIIEKTIKSINKNQLTLNNVDNMKKNTLIQIFERSHSNSYLIEEIDKSKNTIKLDRPLKYNDYDVLVYYLPSNVYNTNITTDVLRDGKQGVDSYYSYSFKLPFKTKKDTLTENQYKELIYLALFKNWCFHIFNFIKNKDYGLQFYIVYRELAILFEDRAVPSFSNFYQLLYLEFVCKSNEFLGPNCANLCNLFAAFLLQLEDYDYSLAEKLKSINKNNLPNDLSKFNTQLNVVEESMNTEKEEIDQNIINKQFVFNQFTISTFQSDFYQKKNNLSDQTTLMDNNNYKSVAKDLELVYQEMENVFNANLSKNKLYYIRNYTNIKSYWDHANITIAQVLQDPSLKYSPMSTDNSEDSRQELQDIPKYLDTWQYNSVLQQGGSNSWITTYLHQENLLTNKDLEIFSNLTFYGLKNHKDFTQGYRSSFQYTMDKFKQKASPEDWKNLQKWSKQILKQIKANQLEEAFQEFKNKVLQLTKQYNPDLQFDSIEALDMYFLAKH